MNSYNYRSNSRFPGCFWIFIIILLLGGPRLLGYLFIFAFLIVIFLIFGGFIILKNFNLNDYLKKQTEAHNNFGKYLVKFMVKMAGADGDISDMEISMIKSFFRNHFRYNNTQMLWVDQLISDALKNDESINNLCAQFKELFGLQEQKILIQLLYQIALVDNYLHEKEQDLINLIVSELKFPEYEHLYLRNMFLRNSDNESPLKALGLEEGSTKEEIKKRYRELSKENHPDKIAHLGKEFQAAAEEKMAKINQAYQKLKTSRRV